MAAGSICAGELNECIFEANVVHAGPNLAPDWWWNVKVLHFDILAYLMVLLNRLCPLSTVVAGCIYRATTQTNGCCCWVGHAAVCKCLTLLVYCLLYGSTRSIFDRAHVFLWCCSLAVVGWPLLSGMIQIVSMPDVIR